MSVNPEVLCWSQVAERTGSRLQLRHVFRGGPRDRKRIGLPSLTASLRGVQVHGEVTADGDPPATYAQLSARVPGSSGLQLRIYRNFLYPQFGRVVGIEDLLVGDPHFDRNFIVKSNDPLYAKLWLGPKVRNAILNAPDYCFDIHGQRASATSHRADDPVQLEAAMNALSYLASRGTELNAQVQRLARRLGSDNKIDNEPWLDGNAPEFEYISGGRRVSLSIVHSRLSRRGSKRLLSRLWCRRLTARSDRFVFYADHLGRKGRPLLASKLARCILPEFHPQGYIAHTSSAQRLREKMSEHWAKAITRLQPLVLSCSEAAVELVWSGAVLDEQRLRDGASLCEYFAVDNYGVVSGGPYR